MNKKGLKIFGKYTIWFLLTPPMITLIAILIAMRWISCSSLTFLKESKNGILFLLGVSFIVNGLIKSVIIFVIQKKEEKPFCCRFDLIFTGIIFLILSLFP